MICPQEFSYSGVFALKQVLQNGYTLTGGPYINLSMVKKNALWVN